MHDAEVQQTQCVLGMEAALFSPALCTTASPLLLCLPACVVLVFPEDFLVENSDQGKAKRDRR